MCRNGALADDAGAVLCVLDDGRFIHRHGRVEGNPGFHRGVITLTGVLKVKVNKIQKVIKRRLKFCFHVRRIKVNVIVHRLNVHLVGRTTKTFIFGIIAHAVFNDCPFEDV